MKLEQSFTVEAPIDVVWAALIDVEQIAPCLPGAEITGQDADGAWEGTFTVKLGPTTAAYRGKIAMQEADEASHTATLSAKGTDKRGQGGATATIVNQLREEDGKTVVDVDTDFAITGKLARFGRSGMIEDISKRLLRDFATCLESHLGSGGGIPAADAPAAAVPGDATASPAVGAAVAGEAAAQAAAVGDAAGPPPPVPGPTPAPRPAAPPPAKPISGFSLVLGALLDRLKRLFKRT